jgi:hypothetical protein
MPASSGADGRSRHALALWLLAAALVAVPPVYTAPSLGGTELDPLAFMFGLVLAGLMAAAGLVAFFGAGRRAVAVPVAVVLAAVGVVGGVALLGDSWAALAGWVAAVAVTVVVVRAAAPG